MSDPKIGNKWRDPESSIVGSGLIALDVLINENRRQPLLSTGGTCGNVMAMLAYLGWKAYPVGRLNQSVASRWLNRDLMRWSVDPRYLHLEPAKDVPVVIQVRRGSKSEDVHRFSFQCPGCRSELPRFRPITLKATKESLDWPTAEVFFTDRVSPAIIALARQYRSQGAVVVFEPASKANRPLFDLMLRVAHIVKYSRAEFSSSLRVPSSVLLQVETLGKKGLRYKSRLHGSRGDWAHLPPFKVDTLQDTAGAGDWCTAGIIHVLGAGGFTVFNRSSAEKVRVAMRFGQALATWNCGYEGARGGMYATTTAKFRTEIDRILATGSYRAQLTDGVSTQMIAEGVGVCPSCLNGGRKA